MKIENIADLLRSFSLKEQEKLNHYKMTHAPTIGLMYEGLTKKVLSHEVLNKLFPKELDLRVTSGFFYNSSGLESNQIDCMLVHGEGEQIPHTNEYKYHIENVIAILEVKKNLFLKEMSDSLDLLERTDEFIDISKNYPYLNKDVINRSFERITKKEAPSANELHLLNHHEYGVYQSLACDQLSPVRIVLGYEGYKSEHGLRKGFIQHYSKMKKFRAFKIPSLIISNNYVIIKTNGYPYYITHSTPDEWIVAASSFCNPLLFMLEIIFHKIEQMYHIDINLDEVALNENTEPLFTIAKKENKWDAYEIDYSHNYLKNRESHVIWEPVKINEEEFSLLKTVERSHTITKQDINRMQLISIGTDKLISKLLDSGHLLHSASGFNKGASFVFIKMQEGDYLLFPSEAKLIAWSNNRMNS